MKKITSGILLMIMVLAASMVLVGCGDPEYDKAEKEFNATVKQVKTQVKNKEVAIKDAEAFLDKKEKALDVKTEDALKQAVEDAKHENVKIPEIPSKTKDVQKKTEELKKIDFTPLINDINTKKAALDKSRKQYKQLTNPSEDFVYKRLKKVKGVKKIAAVTEKKDPNGNLNKPGGYTAAIYFSSPYVTKDTDLFTGDVIEDGTDCGGCIEIYKTEEEAKKRSDYLGTYDGTILASGSHNVFGTVLVRTSDKMTASKQKKLEKAIYKALVKLDK